MLLAVTVFAVVITIALSQLVGVSAADRDLAIQVAAAQQTPQAPEAVPRSAAPSCADHGAPAAGVTVEVFASGS